MVEQRMIILVGLPASGKSTYARKLANDGYVVVSKDMIRLDKRLFGNREYNNKRGDEQFVIKEEERIINSALGSGKSVVVDSTNFGKHQNRLKNIAKQYNAEIEIKSFLDVPIKTLLERDKNREDSVGEQVIRKMFHTQVKKMPTFLKYDSNLETCIISDIDSTLTLGPKNRSPYEWHKVGNDDINLATSAILDGIRLVGYVDKIFLFSGRDEVCRPETEAWLEKNDIEYDALYMRRSDHLNESGGQIADTFVKSEMLEKYVIGKYNVLLVMDDRKVVCDMWRDVYGLNVFQLGDPNWSF